MSEKADNRLDAAINLIDSRLGPEAARTNPSLVVAVLQSATPEPETPAPLPTRCLIIAICFFLWWLMLIVAGHQVNTEGARHLLASLGEMAKAKESVTSETNTSDVVKTQQQMIIFKSYIDGKEFISITNAMPVAAMLVDRTPDRTAKNIFFALLITVLCWTWPNLIFLACAASAFGSLLARGSRSSQGGVSVELAWSMINGFFVVLFLGCSQIFLGDSVYKTLGLAEALAVQIKQDRYLSLAFFASLLGLFLGLSQQRLNSLPGKLPIIGPFFK